MLRGFKAGSFVIDQMFIRAARLLLATLVIYSMVAGQIVTDLGDTQHKESPHAFSGTGKPAPLSEREMLKLHSTIAKIDRDIRRQPCEDFLVTHLGEGIIDQISAKLAEHQAFSGPRSTEINAIDAGVYDDAVAKNIISLTDSPDIRLARAARYEVTRSVAQLFADADGANGRSMAAVVANYHGNPNTAFYKKLKPVGMLHEILHVATGFDDNDLAIKLGVDILPFNGDPELASDAITDILKANHCK